MHSGPGGIVRAVSDPWLCCDASVVCKSTPDVFIFAQRGRETISGLVCASPFLLGCRCMPFGCCRSVGTLTSLYLTLGIGIDMSMPSLCVGV